MLLNPDIIKSKLFQEKWTEICSLLTTGGDKSLMNFYYLTGYCLDPRHTCVVDCEDNTDCQSCALDMQFIKDFEKIFNIEQDLWNYYLYQKKIGISNKFGSMVGNKDINTNFGSSIFDNNIYLSKNNSFYKNTIFNIEKCKDNRTDGLCSQLNPSVFHDKNLNSSIPIENYFISYNNTNNINVDNINIKVNVNMPNQNNNNNNDSKNNIEIDKDVSQNCEKKSRQQKFVIKKNNTNIINGFECKKDKNKFKIREFKELKFAKRENIDKKILRKFKKYLKNRFRKNNIDWQSLGILEQGSKNFWVSFIGSNLLPPMKYSDLKSGDVVEFKSFNTNFMVWLLCHKGSVELYDMYLYDNYQNLLNSFVNELKIKGHEEYQLSVYIKNFARIFSSAYSDKEIFDEKWDMPNNLSEVRTENISPPNNNNIPNHNNVNNSTNYINTIENINNINNLNNNNNLNLSYQTDNNIFSNYNNTINNTANNNHCNELNNNTNTFITNPIIKFSNINKTSNTINSSNYMPDKKIFEVALSQPVKSNIKCYPFVTNNANLNSCVTEMICEENQYSNKYNFYSYKILAHMQTIRTIKLLMI